MYETNPEARTFAMLCHLSALAGFLIPFGNVIGPLVLWLLKREQYEFVNEQGKEALNFQISMLLYAIIAGILLLVFIGLILLPLIGILSLVGLIIGSVKAYSGEPFRYPFTIRFLK